ncbi:unnamed protein product [Vicia faba]|uniref:Transmembrane protein n=1 Tax=Vicia faba TaxID=3906 RepID=A0AAV0ZFT9_VICFA|nr:unnamed protein product [Vicia faba]
MLQNNFFPLHHSLSIFLNSHNLQFPLSKLRLHLHSPLFDLQLVLKASLLSDSSYKVHFSQLAIIFIIVIISALLLSPTHATPRPKKGEDSDERIKTKQTRSRRTIIVLLHLWISEALPTCLQ